MERCRASPEWGIEGGRNRVFPHRSLRIRRHAILYLIAGSDVLKVTGLD
jgi:hypothetical protein